MTASWARERSKLKRLCRYVQSPAINPLEHRTTLGPMAHVRFATTVREQIHAGMAAGAAALIESDRFPEDDGGVTRLNFDRLTKPGRTDTFGAASLQQGQERCCVTWNNA